MFFSSVCDEWSYLQRGGNGDDFDECLTFCCVVYTPLLLRIPMLTSAMLLRGVALNTPLFSQTSVAATTFNGDGEKRVTLWVLCSHEDCQLKLLQVQVSNANKKLPKHKLCAPVVILLRCCTGASVSLDLWVALGRDMGGIRGLEPAFIYLMKLFC